MLVLDLPKVPNYVHIALYKIDIETYCVAHLTLLNVICQIDGKRV